MIPKKPIDVTWTDEQWQAIYEDKKNIYTCIIFPQILH